jgi:hypothetical protein
MSGPGPRIVTGAEAGVGMAALDVAMEMNIPFTGLISPMTAARLRLDAGLCSAQASLAVVGSDEEEITRMNLRNSEGAVFLVHDEAGELSRRTRQRVALATRLGCHRTCINMRRADPRKAARLIREFMDHYTLKKVSFWGDSPLRVTDVYWEARRVLMLLFRSIAEDEERSAAMTLVKMSRGTAAAFSGS